MSRSAVGTARDFDRARAAVNRWRADHAPLLTRDEAILMMLSQWLGREGYLHPEAARRPGAGAPADAGPAISEASVRF